MKNFVTAKWLIENMNDKNIIILDARAELSDPLEGKKQYEISHIEGAHFISLEDTMTGELNTHGGRHPLPDLKKFIKEMEDLGVNDASKIIIYDDGSIAMAGRLWWLFKYIGKEDVYILNGGIEAFQNNEGKLTNKIPEKIKAGKLTMNIKEDINVDMVVVRDSIDDKNIAIVDVRIYKRYIGEFEPLDTVAGHIKSALNYPWTNLVKDGKLIDLKSIERKFNDLKEYEEVIVHCGSGITGTVTFILLDEIGINAKLYSGGYSDWISYKDNGVIQGEN